MYVSNENVHVCCFLKAGDSSVPSKRRRMDESEEQSGSDSEDSESEKEEEVRLWTGSLKPTKI